MTCNLFLAQIVFKVESELVLLDFSVLQCTIFSVTFVGMTNLEYVDLRHLNFSDTLNDLKFSPEAKITEMSLSDQRTTRLDLAFLEPLETSLFDLDLEFQSLTEITASVDLKMSVLARMEVRS